MFESREFRQVMGSFATGVTVATTALPDGTRAGVTVNSFCSVSLDPPLVLFCLDKRALSHPVFSKASGYAINVLTEQQEHVARAFAVPGQGPERWEHGHFSIGLSGVPIMADTLATIDCALHAQHESGDHVVLVGRVLALSRREGQPLLYWNSGYHHLQQPDGVMVNRS